MDVAQSDGFGSFEMGVGKFLVFQDHRITLVGRDQGL